MTADAMAPCLTRPSTIMVLNVECRVAVFRGKGFQLPAMFRTDKNANILFVSEDEFNVIRVKGYI